MKTALYRHFNSDGCLLYVGITDGLSVRDKAHAATSSWHADVVRSETEWFNDRAAARAAETKAILQEKPLHNKMSALKDESEHGEVGFRILSLRAEAGLTQADFAQLIGAKRSQLSNWECGKQRLSLSGAIAMHHALGVSLDWLFLGIGDDQ